MWWRKFQRKVSLYINQCFVICEIRALFTNRCFFCEFDAESISRSFNENRVEKKSRNEIFNNISFVFTRFCLEFSAMPLKWFDNFPLFLFFCFFRMERKKCFLRWRWWGKLLNFFCSNFSFNRVERFDCLEVETHSIYGCFMLYQKRMKSKFKQL